MSYVRHDPPDISTSEAAAAAITSAAAAGTADAGKPSTTAAADGSSSAAAAAASSIPVITFLYKLTPGAADASFGLNVAQVRKQGTNTLMVNSDSFCFVWVVFVIKRPGTQQVSA